MSQLYTTELAYRRYVNKKYRAEDQSHLWPICGKFNVTERAIRRVRKLERCGLVIGDYSEELDFQISEIVNNENN